MVLIFVYRAAVCPICPSAPSLRSVAGDAVTDRCAGSANDHIDRSAKVLLRPSTFAPVPKGVTVFSKIASPPSTTTRAVSVTGTVPRAI